MERFGLFAVADSASFELTYVVPEELFSILRPGAICVLPVKNKTHVGVFLQEVEKPSFSCKAILGTVAHTRPFSSVHLQLVRWISDYYLAPVGRAIRLLAPGFLWNANASSKREARFQKKDLSKMSVGKDVEVKPDFELSDEQKNVLSSIFESMNLVTLLQGVTGSGKTEVYIAAARKVLESGKNILILVPEIALTPQMSQRFRAAFGETLGVVHSGLTPVQYEREWFKTHQGLVRVVLGVRSAVFSPIENLGLIVVDEEHDPSYKCDEFPCYHARDVAVKRGQLEGARVILGSATPSAESYLNAKNERYGHVRLKQRAVGVLPDTNIVDVRAEFQRKNKISQTKAPSRTSLISFQGDLVSEEVIDALREVKARGEQSMIILNRRGFANFALCGACGNAVKCPNCSVSTTLHKNGKLEICHYCGFQRPVRVHCTECGSSALVHMGAGTQHLEGELAKSLPELSVARLDRDVLTSATRLEGILSDFRTGKVDCLVGTQILAKGHDFSRVTLVAILYVEDGLYLPDFRSSERTFQLLTQAAGRAGRGSLAGKVLVQTLVPEHPVMHLALQHDSEGFLVRELESRELGWHPPICRQILLEFSNKVEAVGFTLAQEFRNALVHHWQTNGIPPQKIRVVGPYPAALERLKDVYRFHICISMVKELHPKVVLPKEILFEKKFSGKVRCDVDPYSFL